MPVAARVAVVCGVQVTSDEQQTGGGRAQRTLEFLETPEGCGGLPPRWLIKKEEVPAGATASFSVNAVISSSVAMMLWLGGCAVREAKRLSVVPDLVHVMHCDARRQQLVSNSVQVGMSADEGGGVLCRQTSARGLAVHVGVC